MPGIELAENRRILVIDDNAAIHDDFRKILLQEQRDEDFDALDQQLFGGQGRKRDESFELDTASQGAEGLQKVIDAKAAGRPFAVAFVDMRMPPGWDGLTTIEHLWKADPDLQVVICTAYSDYCWSEMTDRLGVSDQLLIIKKPFDACEISQLALALTQKHEATRQAALKTSTLESLVEQRTAELQKKEEQLRQKQKMEAIGSLAAGVAHEFNNLLQVICGHTAFAMREMTEDDERLEDLKTVLEASSRAGAITNQLLDFSRQRPTQKTVVYVADVVRCTASMMQPLISENLCLTVDCSDDAVAVIADRKFMEQALMNLCINAADAMPDGGEIRITAARETIEPAVCDQDDVDADGNKSIPAGDYAILAVSDNGCGMSEEVRQRIFDPFYTTKDVGKGTGLGLAFVYGAVTQFSGHIVVDTAVDQGTTFKLYLPVCEQEAPSEEFSKKVQVVRGTETILLAEDEPLVREVATRILESAGYTVLAVENGLQAVEQFTQQADQIDLLILDAMMPQMNGYDAIREIRGARPDMKAILCSGYSPEQHLQACRDIEQVPLVQKPFDPAHLLTTIRETLGSVAVG